MRKITFLLLAILISLPMHQAFGVFPFSFWHSAPREVQWLIVGGGGNSAASYSGGGGGGDVVPGSAVLAPGAYPVVVAQRHPSVPNGDSSSFNGIVAIGGGQGAAVGNAGFNGASGGGGSGDGVSGFPGGTATGLFGHNGGAGASGGQVPAGGGGGCGAVGGNAVPNGVSGNGGIGCLSSISGSPVYYGGGGGGGAGLPPGAHGTGGLGGGGDGADQGGTGVDGTDGLGGGAGGGGGTGGLASGGSGSVQFWYAGPPRATGGTISSVNGGTLHYFATNGTFTLLF